MASLAWAALFALSVSALKAPISDFDISCYEESDKGETYKGLMTKTSSGRTCQNWLEDKPWCYTMDPSPDHEKETCDIPVCPEAARDFVDEAKTLATKVAPDLDCECAAQLYGATTTTANTVVSLAGKKVKMWKGKVKDGKCHCLK